MWICPNCNLRLPHVVFPVNCKCGGHFEDPTSDPAIAKTKPKKLVFHTPGWEADQRKSTCQGCDYFKPERPYKSRTIPASCPKVDLGCQRTYHDTIHHTYGKCPEGNWNGVLVKWVTTADLVQAALQLADRLPNKIGRIIAVPRSGLIPASAIATKRHVPLWTIVNNQVVPAGGGSRMLWGERRRDEGVDVVVDDTIHNGGTMQRLRHDIPEIRHIPFAAIFSVSPEKADYCHSQLPTPHLLEWNMLNSYYMKHIAVDFDGIVCHNPPRSHVPHLLPRMVPVRAIITARPESERESTVAWCEKYGVQYERLLMWPGTYDDRHFDDIVRWKSEMFQLVGADLYIESEIALAEGMRNNHIRVLCPQQGFLA